MLDRIMRLSVRGKVIFMAAILLGDVAFLIAMHTGEYFWSDPGCTYKPAGWHLYAKRSSKDLVKYGCRYEGHFGKDPR